MRSRGWDGKGCRRGRGFLVKLRYRINECILNLRKNDGLMKCQAASLQDNDTL